MKMSYYETPNLDEYEKHKLSVIYNDHEKKMIQIPHV